MKPADAAGAVLMLLGSSVMLGWWQRWPMVVRVLQNATPMVIDTALAFLLLGAALCLMRPIAPVALRVARSVAALVALAAVLVLAEHLLSLDLGIDMAHWHAWLNGTESNPGRMSAGTACAFLMAGLALMLTPVARGRRSGAIVRLLTGGVASVGVLALAGHLVNAPLLFPRYVFAGVAIHTACGLVVLALGLWLATRRFAWSRWPLLSADHDRITLAGASILVLISLAAGIATFSLLSGRFETLTRDSVLEALTTRAQAFEDLISLREGNARIAATRPSALRNLRAIQDGRDAGSSAADVRAVVESLLQQGYTGLTYFDSAGRTLVSGGSFVESPALAVTLTTPGRAELLWSGGYLLRHRIAMADAAGPLGSVRVEQRLPVLTRIAQDVASRGETWDMGLCVQRESRLHCFPQRLNPTVFSTPLVNVSGETLPMVRALRGETGVTGTRDYRAQNVVAAYAPVGQTGLGMVVKVDAGEVFRPIREQLLVVIGVLSAFAVGGTWLLRRRVRPLVDKLVDAEALARSQNIELARANQAKDAFFANMSHELRTPLNAILGFTGTLLMRMAGPLSAEQERQLTTVRAAGRHLLALINDLLEVARVEAGKLDLALEPVDAKALLDEVAQTLRQQAEGKGLQLLVAGFDEPVVLTTDRRALAQIVVNLVGNAIKFTEHGEVRIAAGRHAGAAGGAIEISVEDTGIGIALEQQQDLFNPFSRVGVTGPRNPGGTGLGLHLSQKLAEALGGHIMLRSEPGRGSLFTLVLPAR